jgi:hypothetical protein
VKSLGPCVPAQCVIRSRITNGVIQMAACRPTDARSSSQVCADGEAFGEQVLVEEDAAGLNLIKRLGCWGHDGLFGAEDIGQVTSE